jgi:hypothetical protein
MRVSAGESAFTSHRRRRAPTSDRCSSPLNRVHDGMGFPPWSPRSRALCLFNKTLLNADARHSLHPACFAGRADSVAHPREADPVDLPQEAHSDPQAAHPADLLQEADSADPLQARADSADPPDAASATSAAGSWSAWAAAADFPDPPEFPAAPAESTAVPHSEDGYSPEDG